MIDLGAIAEQNSHHFIVSSISRTSQGGTFRLLQQAHTETIRNEQKTIGTGRRGNHISQSHPNDASKNERKRDTAQNTRSVSYLNART